MTSILTNTSAMSAMSSLAVVQRSLAKTESQITTGLRVATAQANPAYWSIATSMTTRVGEMRAVDDGLDLTSSIISTTTAALTAILGLTQGIAKDLVTAQTAGVDPATVQTDIAAKQQGIIAAAQSASFNGVNWLVSQSQNTYTSTTSHTWAGTYADVNVNRGSTPIAYTSHTVNTVTTARSQGPSATSTTTSIFDDSGTIIPSADVISQHIVDGPVTTTGDQSADTQDVSVLLTTGPATIVDLTSLQLFSTHDDVAGPVVDHATFTDGERDLIGHYVFTDPFGVSTTGSGALAQPISLTQGTTSLLSLDATDYSQADLAAASAGVSNALSSLQSAMTLLGGLQDEVDGSKALNTAISDALTSGIGSLVDADMNDASTRLQALQTQQSLGVQALGIANQNSQVVMKLFGG